MMKQNHKPKTLFDKIWSNHLVDQQVDGTCLIYIDRHLVHEVTSPQAFEGLRNNNRKVRKPECTFAVADHNVPEVIIPLAINVCPTPPSNTYFFFKNIVRALKHY